MKFTGMELTKLSSALGYKLPSEYLHHVAASTWVLPEDHEFIPPVHIEGEEHPPYVNCRTPIPGLKFVSAGGSGWHSTLTTDRNPLPTHCLHFAKRVPHGGQWREGFELINEIKNAGYALDELDPLAMQNLLHFRLDEEWEILPPNTQDAKWAINYTTEGLVVSDVLHIARDKTRLPALRRRAHATT